MLKTIKKLLFLFILALVIPCFVNAESITNLTESTSFGEASISWDSLGDDVTYGIKVSQGLGDFYDVTTTDYSTIGVEELLTEFCNSHECSPDIHDFGILVYTGESDNPTASGAIYVRANMVEYVDIDLSIDRRTLLQEYYPNMERNVLRTVWVGEDAHADVYWGMGSDPEGFPTDLHGIDYELECWSYYTMEDVGSKGANCYHNGYVAENTTFFAVWRKKHKYAYFPINKYDDSYSFEINEGYNPADYTKNIPIKNGKDYALYLDDSFVRIIMINNGFYGKPYDDLPYDPWRCENHSDQWYTGDCELRYPSAEDDVASFEWGWNKTQELVSPGEDITGFWIRPKAGLKANISCSDDGFCFLNSPYYNALFAIQVRESENSEWKTAHTWSFSIMVNRADGTPIPYEDEEDEPTPVVTKYDVTLNYNGGSAVGASSKKYQTESITVNITEDYFMKNFLNSKTSVTAPIGSVFNGVEINGKQYNIGSKVTINSNMTIKYLWKKLYKITFDYNGGKKDGKTSSTSTVANSSLTLDKNTLTKGVTPPEGKEIDYILVNNEKKSFGSSYSLKATNIIKYVWKDIKPDLTGFKIAGGNTTSINLEWNRVYGTGYYVYRSTNNKKWTKIATINKATTLKFTDTKLTANKTYYYKIEGYKTVNGKNTSMVVSKVLGTKTAPKVAKIKVKTSTYNTVTINVKKVTGAKKYILERSTDNKEFIVAKTVSKAGNIKAANLDTGIKYYFRIKACNEKNICSITKVVNVTPILKKPTIKVSSKKKTQITIKVPAVAGANGYVIERSLSKSKGFMVVAEVNSAKSYIDKDLASKKKYFYRVRAYRNVKGKKIFSAYSKVVSTKVK